MKKLLRVTSLALLAIILAYPLCWAQQSGGPRMVLEETLFDAKVVEENAVIEHAFKVLNTGDSPLRIDKVKPT